MAEYAVNHTFVVMEAAATHDGDLSRAIQLVDLAANVGADACKFQWVSNPERLAARRHVPKYLEHYRRLSFPRHWFEYLCSKCKDRGVEFMCTTYLPEDISVVAEHVQRFKVSSFEATDVHFVLCHAEFPKPLIVSAGMGADLRHVVAQYVRARGGEPGPHHEFVKVLHCVSAYPAPMNEMNLRRLRANSDYFSGLSDHTRHPWTGALAVAAGASIVEFHARLIDTSSQNPDYCVAKSPGEALEYVANLRLAESAVGSDDYCGRVDDYSGATASEVQSLQYRVCP